MTDGNDSINPIDYKTEKGEFGSTETYYFKAGLTKREYFAAMAMQGILANTNRTESYEDATIFSVGYADALINELNKQP